MAGPQEFAPSLKLKRIGSLADAPSMGRKQSATATGALAVGPDRVTCDGQCVIIDAAREMPEWRVREFARIPIFFQGRKYFLRQKRPGRRPYSMRYLLEAWPSNLHESAPFVLSYDEEAVAQRDQEFTSNRINDFIGKALYLVYPFLGLFWSDTKDRLIRFGFVPRTITSVSIHTLAFLGLLQGVLAGRLRTGFIALLLDKPLLTVASWTIPVLFLDYVLLGLVVLDCIIRFDQSMRESPIEWGFFEWIKKPFLRRKSVVIDGHEIPMDIVRAALKEEGPGPAHPDASNSERKAA